MASAAVAAFFYLRLAVTMFSPVGDLGDATDTEVGEEDGRRTSRPPATPWPASRC